MSLANENRLVKSRQKKRGLVASLTLPDGREYHSLPTRLDVGHDVVHPGHAKGQNRLRLEVERLDGVFQTLLAFAFGLGLGQEFRLETGHEVRGKLGAVVAEPLDGIVGVLDVVDAHVEAPVGLADQRIVLDFAVGALRLEILVQSFLFPATVDGVLVVHPKLDRAGIDLPDLRGAEDEGERLQGLPGLDGGLRHGLRVQTDELPATDGRVEHEGFEGGVGEDDGHILSFCVSTLLSRAVVRSLFPSDI